MGDQLEWYEMPFDVLGLNTPGMRFIACSSLALAAVTTLKPSFAYLGNGEPRPFKLFNQTNRDATWVPWWLPAILFGSVAATFV